MDAAQVAVCELGPLGLERDGTVAVISGSRAPSVLAALALRGKQGCRTTELIEWCWPPPTQPPTARRSLANIIARLREALGRSAIETTEDGYRLAVWVGSHRQQFLELAGEAERAVADGDAGLAMDHADTALDLWRGVPWDGFDALDGIDADRALLAGARSRLLAVQAESAEMTGNRSQAVTLWEQLAADEPYNERWWGRLARCHLDDGRRTTGLRVLQLARKNLAEVGLLPGAGLASIESQLLGVDTPADSTVKNAASDGHSLAIDRSISFVGRIDERGEILRFLDRADQPRGLLIAGQAGAGKTRLLVECLRERPEMQIFAGRAEAEPSGLLGPLAALFLDHRSALPDGHLHALSPLVPGLVGPDRSSKPAHGSAADVIDPARAAMVTASAIRYLLRSHGGAAVLVIDDLHWASPVVFAALTQVLGAADPDGPILLATHRSLPPELAGETAKRTAAMAVMPSVMTLDLGPLSQPEVAELADDGGFTGDTTALYGATGGNALFVTESVRSNEPGTVSRPLRSVVRSRVERVDQLALRYLELASLCGTEFRADLVARTLELTPEVSDRLTDALFDAGLLLPVAGRNEHARFTHALVAEAVQPPLGRRRRQRLHLDLATSYREAGQPETRWIGHLVAAGSLVDEATMAEAVGVAIEAFNRQHDYGAVAELCRQALAGELSPGQAAPLQIELGRSLMRLSISDEGRSELAGAADTARQLGDPFLMAKVALTYSTTGAWRKNADQTGPALLGEALQMLSSIEGSASEIDKGTDLVVLRARLEARLASWNVFTSSLDERDEATRAMLAMVRVTGDDVALVDALNARHIAISCPAALTETRAVEAELEQLEVAGRGTSEIEGSPLPGTYWAADSHHFYAGFERRLKRPDRDLHPMTGFLKAVRASYSGDTETVRQQADESLALEDVDVSRGIHTWLHVVANWIDGAVGQSQSLVDRRHFELGGAPLRCTALWVRAAAEDSAGVMELRDRISARSLARLPELFLGGYGLGSAAMAAEAMGDQELGQAVVDVLQPYRHQMLGVPWASYPCGAFFLGVIEATWGSPDRAAEEFAIAADIHHRMGAESFVTLAERWT